MALPIARLGRPRAMLIDGAARYPSMNRSRNELKAIATGVLAINAPTMISPQKKMLPLIYLSRRQA